jgi:hypothetical protein
MGPVMRVLDGDVFRDDAPAVFHVDPFLHDGERPPFTLEFVFSVGDLFDERVAGIGPPVVIATET